MREEFDHFDTRRWVVGDHTLGRSRLAPAHVSVTDRQLRLALPAGTVDGAEVRSHTLFGYGKYEARIRVPAAPSSITGFFLYHPPDLAREIDIEIFNDPRGKMMCTYYREGAEVSETAPLPFDPTAGFHDYSFEYAPERLAFRVDGAVLQTFVGRMPDPPMHLYVNAWFPRWLSGEPPADECSTVVDRIVHTPMFSAAPAR